MSHLARIFGSATGLPEAPAFPLGTIEPAAPPPTPPTFPPEPGAIGSARASPTFSGWAAGRGRSVAATGGYSDGKNEEGTLHARTVPWAHFEWLTEYLSMCLSYHLLVSRLGCSRGT